MAGPPSPPQRPAGLGPVRRPHAVLLGTLLAGLLMALSPWQERVSDLINDMLVRWAAPEPALSGVLVIDIDDASLAELLPRFGPWPWRRDTHALAVDFLREAGARVIGLDIVFGDAREGDAALAGAIARPGAPVVLAAAGLRHASDGPGPAAGLPALAAPVLASPSAAPASSSRPGPL